MYDALLDVRAFIIGNDQDTGISLGKQNTTPGEVHLVIGVVSRRFGMALSDLNIYQRCEEAMRQ